MTYVTASNGPNGAAEGALQLDGSASEIGRPAKATHTYHTIQLMTIAESGALLCLSLTTTCNPIENAEIHSNTLCTHAIAFRCRSMLSLNSLEHSDGLSESRPIEKVKTYLFYQGR